MKITIIAPGSRGDIQPYVALGRGLVRSGHTVRVVTNQDHAALVQAHGLPLCQVDINVQAELQAGETGGTIESGKILASFRRFAEIAKRAATELLAKSVEASEGQDAVLAGIGGVFAALAVAEKLRLPLIQAYNVPLTPTAAYAGALVPWLSFWPRGVWHRLGHRLTRQAVWTTARSSGNNARREILGQRPAPWSWPAALAPGRLGPLLYGLSPAFLGKPHDWPPAIEVTGFWSLVEETAWTPPPELLRFIERGPAPVYLGFGSMSHRSPEATTRLVLSAIQQSGQRALLHTGWGGLDPGTVPDNVLMIGSVPHAWLFERVAAVVHHGGAGTTAAGVRAGVPSLIVPFHGDQPFWAARVAALGVGPRPIKRQRLTAPALAEAIKRAVSDEPMRRRAAELGALVRAEDGVGQAVAVIERALRA